MVWPSSWMRIETAYPTTNARAITRETEAERCERTLAEYAFIAIMPKISKVNHEISTGTPRMRPKPRPDCVRPRLDCLRRAVGWRSGDVTAEDYNRILRSLTAPQPTVVACRHASL